MWPLGRCFRGHNFLSSRRLRNAALTHPFARKCTSKPLRSFHCFFLLLSLRKRALPTQSCPLCRTLLCFCWLPSFHLHLNRACYKFSVFQFLWRQSREISESLDLTCSCHGLMRCPWPRHFSAVVSSMVLYGDT